MRRICLDVPMQFVVKSFNSEQVKGSNSYADQDSCGGRRLRTARPRSSGKASENLSEGAGRRVHGRQRRERERGGHHAEAGGSDLPRGRGRDHARQPHLDAHRAAALSGRAHAHPPSGQLRPPVPGARHRGLFPRFRGRVRAQPHGPLHARRQHGQPLRHRRRLHGGDPGEDHPRGLPRRGHQREARDGLSARREGQRGLGHAHACPDLGRAGAAQRRATRRAATRRARAGASSRAACSPSTRRRGAASRRRGSG